MTVIEACDWLQNLTFPTLIRESDWLFPTIESVHVLALVLVVGSISMVDLRLLGLANRSRPVAQVMAQALPWTWSAFVVAAVAGSLLFSSKAVTYYADVPFRIKMFCLVLAGINMAYFHRFTHRRLGPSDLGAPPAAAKIAGGISLLLWIVIVGAGRWIGFTT
ncbi:MAG: DUF6644 family protein [Gammaproteobacteria bacterium]